MTSSLFASIMARRSESCSGVSFGIRAERAAFRRAMQSENLIWRLRKRYDFLGLAFVGFHDTWSIRLSIYAQGFDLPNGRGNALPLCSFVIRSTVALSGEYDVR